LFVYVTGNAVELSKLICNGCFDEFVTTTLSLSHFSCIRGAPEEDMLCEKHGNFCNHVWPLFSLGTDFFTNNICSYFKREFLFTVY